MRRLPTNDGIKERYPSISRYFTNIGSSSVRTVADRHRLNEHSKLIGLATAAMAKARLHFVIRGAPIMLWPIIGRPIIGAK